MYEPEPDTAMMASIHDCLMELRRYLLPEARMWEVMARQGPDGELKATLADNTEISIDPKYLEERLRLVWCSVCGHRPNEAPRLNRWAFTLPEPAERTTRICSMCDVCMNQLLEDEKEFPQWHQQIRQAFAELLYRQRLREWEAEHPRRMAPFR